MIQASSISFSFLLHVLRARVCWQPGCELRSGIFARRSIWFASSRASGNHTREAALGLAAAARTQPSHWNSTVQHVGYAFGRAGGYRRGHSSFDSVVSWQLATHCFAATVCRNFWHSQERCSGHTTASIPSTKWHQRVDSTGCNSCVRCARSGRWAGLCSAALRSTTDRITSSVDNWQWQQPHNWSYGKHIQQWHDLFFVKSQAAGVRNS